MKSSILAALGFAGATLAHGVVKDICIEGNYYKLYDPDINPYQNTKPDLPGWSVPGDGPVEDVTSAAIVCNSGSENGTVFAHAEAGDKVTFFWNKWAESHKGPTMTYLAPVTSKDPTKLDFFKIDHAGLLPDGTWIADSIRANNNSYTVEIPRDLKAGHYVLRHELVALHGADKLKGAQFYPVCINLEVSGYGNAEPTDTVKFPGAYKPDDKGILLNIWYPKPTSYVIPGPAPYKESVMGQPKKPIPTAEEGYPSPTAKPIPDELYPSESPVESISSYPSNNPSIMAGTGTYPTPTGEEEKPYPTTKPEEQPEEEPEETPYPATEPEEKPEEEPEETPYPTTEPEEEPEETPYPTSKPEKEPKESYPEQPEEITTITHIATVTVTLPAKTRTRTIYRKSRHKAVKGKHSKPTKPDFEPVYPNPVITETVTVYPSVKRPQSKNKTVTVTVTSTPACTPAGRYRSYWN